MCVLIPCSRDRIADRSVAAPHDADTPQHRYTAELAGEIERAWQQTWAESGTFNVPNPVGSLAPPDGTPVPADKMFVQDMFPYPSGEGLHVGHPLGYIATDVYARYYRMTGRNVLHALGFDAFGLPAEQYAIQTGHASAHPHRGQHRQLPPPAGPAGLRARRPPQLLHHRRRLLQVDAVDLPADLQRVVRPGRRTRRGRSPSWSPSSSRAQGLSTTGASGRSLSADERADVIDSYRLVYRADSMVNWCPGLGTVLANEEVTSDGRSERGNFPVFRKRLRQWMMRITAYSDRLLDDLEVLDWPEKVKAMQRNWIGRSTGASVLFAHRRRRHRGVHHPARHPVRRDLHGAGARTRAGGQAHRGAVARRCGPAVDVRCGDARRGGRRLPCRHRGQVRSGAPGEQGQDRRVPRRLRHESGQRPTDSGVHRRLRADRLRHRRHHGGARRRPAGLGLRARVRPADRGNGCRRRHFAGGLQRRRRDGELRLPRTG